MSQIDRRRFVANAGALLAMIGEFCPACAQPMPQAPQNPATSDPFAVLNMSFRELYKANRDEILPATPLAALMLIGTGEVWRIEHGVPVKSYPPIPWIAQIKGLMHGVIATQATSARLIRSANHKAALTSAATLAKQLASAEKLVVGAFPAGIEPSVAMVIRGLRQLADGWASGQPASQNGFSEQLKKLQPDLDKVILAAGEATYESVVKGLQQLIAESNPKDWNRALVGVCGVGFARRDSVEIAAAMSVMGRDTVGTRLLYLENAFTIADGIKQLSASLADLALGQDVFGDPYRMWRDLFGDVAAKHAGGGFFPEMGRAE
jgi:hypothetical protein